MDVGVTHLQCPRNLQNPPYKDEKHQGRTVVALAIQTYRVLESCTAYHASIQKFNGGRWRYRLTVSLTLANFTIRRYKNSRVDVSTQTYGVLEISNVYHTKIQNFKGGRCRYKLAVSSVLQFQVCRLQRRAARLSRQRRVNEVPDRHNAATRRLGLCFTFQRQKCTMLQKVKDETRGASLVIEQHPFDFPQRVASEHHGVWNRTRCPTPGTWNASGFLCPCSLAQASDTACMKAWAPTTSQTQRSSCWSRLCSCATSIF